MSHDDGTPAPAYPLTAPGALEAPAEWRELRTTCPVAPVTLPSGDRAALLTRYDDVKQVLSDPRCTRQLDAEGAARISADPSGGVFNSAMAASLNGAGQQRWRRMLTKWFTAKRMNALRPAIEAMAEQLVDEMVDRGHPADLKASVGFPLPVWVICDLLGVPAADRDRFSRWSDMLLNLTRYGRDEIDTAQRDFHAYLTEHLEAKRAEPGEDLLSSLITATDADGGRLTDDQLAATGQALLIAGHETTANMIGKMMALLLADRRRWQQLVADPALVRTAVEEVLRYDANAGFGMPRYVTQDIDVAGTVLPRGATLVCSMAAANRDGAVFAAADDLRLERSPNPHLAFGAGPHSCLGQALARTELQVVLDVLLRRLPSLELAVPVSELRRIEGLVVGGLCDVPVRW
ncbi:cytochrome P450 [Streptomyces noursei]|uniref:Cytochrome P450 n=1 Tax=Streptomyces noursei TaxID=1971 RepID=A0A401QTC2_STRNR|nr:cytochrome P450 [Streptomyces noursei]AKA01543.1 cytochrome P450 [Streptomyces noursei ZPM]EXU92095.1 cytochrome P450 [Streptomyces noursei PD-1]UWS69969.1 cytochrome P450 [Streptomyces noursei]GCB88605.1 cytochrome P450 [Streptomyces noursei]